MATGADSCTKEEEEEEVVHSVEGARFCLLDTSDTLWAHEFRLVDALSSVWPGDRSFARFEPCSDSVTE